MLKQPYVSFALAGVNLTDFGLKIPSPFCSLTVSNAQISSFLSWELKITVVGDQKGRIGYGLGKANDVSEAIKKSIDKAKRNLITMPLKNGTIPHDIIGKYKSSEVLLKPACSGTGIIAGGAVRAIMDAAGATDLLSKSLGSSSAVNVVRATFDAVEKLMDAKKVAANRGKTLDELWG